MLLAGDCTDVDLDCSFLLHPFSSAISMRISSSSARDWETSSWAASAFFAAADISRVIPVSMSSRRLLRLEFIELIEFMTFAKAMFMDFTSSIANVLVTFSHLTSTLTDIFSKDMIK